MNSLLVHGCYDLKTLETLRHLGIRELSFDLRGRSPNLITFRDLKALLSKLSTEKVFLTFGDDKKETILSFLNLLKDEPYSFTLIFREHSSLRLFEELKLPFYWMFHPDGDFKSILSLPNAKGVLLPIKLKKSFENLGELWEMIDRRNLDVYLHAETIEETLFLNFGPEVKLSLDLSKEIEKSYRNVDQEKLKTMKIWRRINESSAGQ